MTGDTPFERAVRLEAMMVKVFGEDFREGGFSNAGGSFQFADVFEECGLHDPSRPLGGDRGGQGLWGWTSTEAMLRELETRCLP